MIARQRDNLKRTFNEAEEAKAEPATLERLAKNEREIGQATAEFTEGIEQRAGPVPCLHDAQDAMQAAVAALEHGGLKEAGGSEEAALADLIKARQNLRKFLSRQSSSASACRKFDNQQQQKLRKPPREDKKQRLAKLQQEIEQLAREERKFSEDVAPKSGGAQMEKDADQQKANPQKSPGKSSGGSPSASQSQAQLAERQEKAAAKAEELQKLVREDDALTQLARERMDQAAESARAGAQSMENGRKQEAGQKAGEAAEQLERLARHVAGLKEPELSTRLGQSEGMARQLARQQQTLGKELQGKEDGDKSGSGRGRAEDERRLAEEARTLADLLRRLQRDAAGKNRDLAEQLDEATQANPPQAAAEQMGRAAEALKAGQAGQARPDVQGSARILDALGQHLESARHALTRPQLDRLMALEKQAAETQKALESVNAERQKADAEKKVADLRDALSALPQKEGNLSEAAERLDAATRTGNPSWNYHEKHDPRVGAYVPPVEYTEGVNRAVQALQAQIQEIILKDALLDKDEAVPPQYRKLVEEYYRVLSEDVR